MIRITNKKRKKNQGPTEKRQFSTPIKRNDELTDHEENAKSEGISPPVVFVVRSFMNNQAKNKK